MTFYCIELQQPVKGRQWKVSYIVPYLMYLLICKHGKWVYDTIRLGAPSLFLVHGTSRVLLGLCVQNTLYQGSLSFRDLIINVLFNDALNAFYLRLYGVRHMVKDHLNSERANPLPPHGLLFLISSKGSFICIIPQRGYHIQRPLLQPPGSTGWNEK